MFDHILLLFILRVKNGQSNDKVGAINFMLEFYDDYKLMSKRILL